MKKFIVIYRAPKSLMANMPKPSPEQAQENMKPWLEWARKCGSGLVDLGAPLGNAHKMSQNEHGPVESDVAGYSVLQTENLAGIRKMIEGHPHLAWNSACEIEVHEVLPLPGM